MADQLVSCVPRRRKRIAPQNDHKRTNEREPLNRRHAFESNAISRAQSRETGMMISKSGATPEGKA